jgi:hypothetical protein
MGVGSVFSWRIAQLSLWLDQSCANAFYGGAHLVLNLVRVRSLFWFWH